MFEFGRLARVFPSLVRQRSSIRVFSGVEEGGKVQDSDCTLCRIGMLADDIFRLQYRLDYFSSHFLINIHKFIFYVYIGIHNAFCGFTLFSAFFYQKITSRL